MTDNADPDMDTDYTTFNIHYDRGQLAFNAYYWQVGLILSKVDEFVHDIVDSFTSTHTILGTECHMVVSRDRIGNVYRYWKDQAHVDIVVPKKTLDQYIVTSNYPASDTSPKNAQWPLHHREVIDRHSYMTYFYPTHTEWTKDGTLHRTDGPAIAYVSGARSWYKDGLLHRDGDDCADESSIHKGWYKNGQLHREGDLPAFKSDTRRAWYKDGLRHRETGPAVMDNDGPDRYFIEGVELTEEQYNTRPTKTVYGDRTEYKFKGKLHRDGGPALICATGEEEWYQHGELHRDDGPAASRLHSTLWMKHGQYHREDGPAYVNGRFKSWWINGKRHREDGPAIVNESDDDVYYIDGKKLTKEQFDNRPTRTVAAERIEYTVNGKKHREDGPALEFISGSNKGDKYWYMNGLRHRVDGPAAEMACGDKYWYQNDKLHRLDGPAYDRSNGTAMWYIHGVCYNKDKYDEAVKRMKEPSTTVEMPISSTKPADTRNMTITEQAGSLRIDTSRVSDISITYSPTSIRVFYKSGK